MKKFLIVLIAVAMASFLFVGCFLEPDEPVDPDDPIIGDCPIVEVTSQVPVEGKNYIKSGKQEITVTFAVPTEPVSVYVGYNLRLSLEELLRAEVIMYSNEDKTVYTGDFAFGEEIGGCSEAYIYVETCETCDYCKYPYTVDTVEPYANIEITLEECACPDNEYIKFDSAWIGETNNCVIPGGCCGDDCSGLASWTIDIYDRDPSGECEDPCAELLFSCEGIACPIFCTTDCRDDWFEGERYIYALIELKDVVGNTEKYIAELYSGFEDMEIGDCP